MDRRTFLKQSGGAAILGAGLTTLSTRPAWAQGTSSLADLGLPELSITLSEAGFEVSPGEAAAGWTLVTFENTLPEGNLNNADLMLLPEGQTIEDVMNSIATASDEGPPALFYETTWAGGPSGPSGTPAHAAVNLTAGDWMIWSAGEDYAATALTVTRGSDATPAAPTLTADLEVTFQEFAFVGLGDVVPAGEHVWKFTNTGEQPHFMLLFSVPDGTTTEQLLGAFMGMMSGTPVPDALDLESASPVGGCSNLSTGQTAWHALDLAAGSYVAVCFVPDPETGAPHAMLGMGTAFTAE